MGEYSIKVYPNDQTQQLGWSKDGFSDAHLLLMNKLMEGDGCWQLSEKKSDSHCPITEKLIISVTHYAITTKKEQCTAVYLQDMKDAHLCSVRKH